LRTVERASWQYPHPKAFCANSIKFYRLPAPAIHPLRISDCDANQIEGLIQMPISMPSQQDDLGSDHRNGAPTRTALEAGYQRKIAIGWLYLVDITSDDVLRAGYERIARHHLQLADAEETAGRVIDCPSEPRQG